MTTDAGDDVRVELDIDDVVVNTGDARVVARELDETVAGEVRASELRTVDVIVGELRTDVFAGVVRAARELRTVTGDVVRELRTVVTVVVAGVVQLISPSIRTSHHSDANINRNMLPAPFNVLLSILFQLSFVNIHIFRAPDTSILPFIIKLCPM